MDTHSIVFSSIESISKRPFSQKRYRQRSTFEAPNGKHFSSHLFDIYRFLFRILEEHNLELAYRFRYVVEAAGSKPFIERQNRLDKALKSAKNKAYQPLRNLLNEIQLELELDFDFLMPGIKPPGILRLKQADETHEKMNVAFGYLPETRAPYQIDSPSPLEWMNRYTIVLEYEDETPDPSTKESAVGLHENAIFELDKIRKLTKKEPDIETVTPRRTVKTIVPPPVKKETLPVAQTISDENEEIFEKQDAPTTKYSFDNFKLPPAKNGELIGSSESQEEENWESQPVAETQKKGGEENKSDNNDEGTSSKGLNRFSFGLSHSESAAVPNRNELLNQEENKYRQKRSIPPPLYKFKIELKKPSNKPANEINDPGAMLVISQECINRRTNTNPESIHFLNGSTFWNHFRKQNTSPGTHRDTTSLLVDPDCIKHRIDNIKLEKRHALELSQGEEETFKAFDSFFSLKKEFDKTVDLKEAATNVVKDTAQNIDKKQELIDNDEQRHAIYQQSLDKLVKKDGTLFDYLSGKISIDETDKLEIERWVRAQRSVHTEMYRVYSEAILQPDISDISEIQEFAKSRLKTQDFPSQRVRDIFDKIKESRNIEPLGRDDLVRILKRQDFLQNVDNENDTTIIFSRAYSRYREWRSGLESPDIKVRTVDSAHRSHIIPKTDFIKRLNFLESPIIKVRTSSDYLKNQALPILEKISNWRKPHGLIKIKPSEKQH